MSSGVDMRLASYNVENLFDRPKAMNLADKAAGSALLDAHGELTVAAGAGHLHPRGQGPDRGAARHAGTPLNHHT